MLNFCTGHQGTFLRNLSKAFSRSERQNMEVCDLQGVFGVSDNASVIPLLG